MASTYHRLLATLVEQAAQPFKTLLATSPDFYLSFNVTPRQLCQPGFAERLTALMADNALPARNICIEITERQVIAEPDQAALAG